MDINTNIAVSEVQVLKGPADLRGPYVEYKNTSSKTYKYVHFSFIPYNAVGDTVADKPSSIKATGPEEPEPGLGMTYKLYKDDVWRDNTIVHIVIDPIRIEYMDGSEELLDGDAIHKAHEQYKAAISEEQSQKDADWRRFRIKGAIIFGFIGLIILFLFMFLFM